MSGYSLGKRSIDNLSGVHPLLVDVVKLAISRSTQDFAVICGVRTIEQQKELYAQGRTKPGNIVTWTMKSRHLPDSYGYGRAVDIVPFPVDWNSPSKFDAINDAMQAAASDLGLTIRWGADWDQDGNPREKGETDSPHWEIIL